MNSTPVIDMFSGTGQLARAVSVGLVEPARPVSFSDTYRPARKYLRHRFPDAEVCKDFRDQIVPEGSIVTIGAPCQNLSVAGKCAGADRGETEYVLSTTHYFFVWPVESTIRVRADNYLQLKKGT